MLNRLVVMLCFCLLICGISKCPLSAKKIAVKKVNYTTRQTNIKQTGARKQTNDILKKMSEERIFFGYDQSNVIEASADTLLDMIEVLQDNPDVRILLTGHTDNRGSHEYNLALGARRAEAAKMFMINCAPYLEKRIKTASKGEAEPLVNVKDHSRPEHSKYEKEHAKNRRVEFSFFTE